MIFPNTSYVAFVLCCNKKVPTHLWLCRNAHYQQLFWWAADSGAGDLVDAVTWFFTLLFYTLLSNNSCFKKNKAKQCSPLAPREDKVLCNGWIFLDRPHSHDSPRRSRRWAACSECRISDRVTFYDIISEGDGRCETRCGLNQDIIMFETQAAACQNLPPSFSGFVGHRLLELFNLLSHNFPCGGQVLFSPLLHVCYWYY